MEEKYGLIPDLIFFTGDVAFGQDHSKSLLLEDQYIEAQEFIEKILNTFSRSIPKTNIFIVPGNHDVNRTQITPDQIEWLKNLQKSGKENAGEIINRLMKSNDKQWNRYMERLADYRHFLEKGGYDHLLGEPERLLYSTIREINGFKVGITGLNSSWSSSGDGEKGNLWLGIYQILSSYRSRKDAMFSISLIHHPPNWFTEFEELNIRKNMERMFNFCLHGHEHQEWISRINQHIRIASGALYNGYGKENVYNFVRLYPEENKGEIFLRKYDNGHWIPHIIGGETDDYGIYNLEFLNIPNLEKSLNTSIKIEENTTNNKLDIVTHNHEEKSLPRITVSLNKNIQGNLRSKSSKHVRESQIRLKTFYSTNEFFSRYLKSTNLLNHTYTFVGQDDILSQLDDFIEHGKKIALLPGRGGIGKSRILLEFGNIFESKYHEWELRYLNESVSLTVDSIHELPERKCVIVVDDAHRRKDIVTLLETAQQADISIKIIMAFRPHGRNYIRNICNRCGFDTREIEEISEVQGLKRKEKETLGKNILVDNQYLESLIQVAKDSTIVLVVGAQLIAKNKIQPAFLEQNQEFQDTVFRRFQEDILSGSISDDLEAAFCQDILSIISILSPIPKDDRFIERVSEFFDINKSKLNRSIDILERNGALHLIGSKLRITPNILSDYILRNSCITSYGDCTGYSQEIFEAFGDIYRENILNNLSELDWRVNRKREEADLLVGIWDTIVDEFKNSTNFERANLFGELENIAYFQPRRTLKLIEYAINNPISEKNGSSLYNFTHDDVLEKIPPLLRNISHNIEYTGQSCEFLWNLANDETKKANSKSKYAMTVVDLAKYEMYKPLEHNSIVLDFVERQLKYPNDYDRICSLLDILDPMLEKEGIANRLTGAEVSFIPFLVSYENTKHIRRKVISLIGGYLNSKSTKVVLRALKSLSEALNQPMGFFGKSVSTAEIEIWLPEQMGILKIIEEASKITTDPIVKIQIKSSLAWHARQTNQPEVAEKASSIIRSLPEDFDTKFMRAVWYHYDRDYENFEENQKQISQEMEKVAREFLNRCNNKGKQIFDSLNETITKFQIIEITINPADFLVALSTIDHEIACEICNHIISDTSKPLANYLEFLLLGIRRKDENTAIRLTETVVNSGDMVLCRSVAEGYAYRGWALRLKNEEIKIITQLLSSLDTDTRKLAIESLGYFPNSLKDEALKLALSVELGNDEKLADMYCSMFNKHGISPENLDAEQLKLLLEKLSKIKTIEGNLYYLNIFLTYCSTKIPEKLVDFLLERVDLSKNVKYNLDGFQPLPYIGFFGKGLDGISLSPHYKEILRKVRDRSLIPDQKDRFWLPKLYSYISDFSSTSLEVLNEWINTNDEEKIKAVGVLVKEAPSDFVFSHSDLVSNLLTNAQVISDECYIEVRSNLSDSVLYGVKTGIPGQPSPQDEKLRDKAQEFMEKYQPGSPTWDFYNWLYEQAKKSISDWIQRDKEMMED